MADSRTLLSDAVARCREQLAAANKSGDGIGPATDALIRAENALKRYDEQQASASDRFATVTDAAAWVMAQGYLVKARSAQEHIKAGVPREADGRWRQDKVEEYARRTWSNPRREAEAPATGGDDYKARLVKANAELLELKLKQQRGDLLDAAEEEARDAALLLALRRHLEQWGPECWQATCGFVAAILGDEVRAQLLQRQPEFLELYADRLADAFDMASR